MLNAAQLLGLDCAHLVAFEPAHQLHPQAARAFEQLRRAARDAGFELAIASAFRSFERQAAIWNSKLCGQRAVHDDAGHPLDLAALSLPQRIEAVLRYSALPGASRHHWGTEVDIFDAAALAPGQAVQLVPAEVAPGGVFDALHRWLDARIAAGDCFGFYRPYGRDLGGTAVERWHLSYAPLSAELMLRVTPALLREAWRQRSDALQASVQVQERLPALLRRFGPAAVCPPPLLGATPPV